MPFADLQQGWGFFFGFLEFFKYFMRRLLGNSFPAFSLYFFFLILVVFFSFPVYPYPFPFQHFIMIFNKDLATKILDSEIHCKSCSQNPLKAKEGFILDLMGLDIKFYILNFLYHLSSESTKFCLCIAS